MVSAKHLVFLAVVLYSQTCRAFPGIYEEVDEQYEGHHHQRHHELHDLPPATSYATISTTHVKVQHPQASAASPKYATPYKYEYLSQPQVAYKYVSLPSAAALQQAAGKYEEPSTPGYKYLAASPTYKYVQPPAVTTEPEAAEVPTNSLKFALKYEQNSFKQQQQQLQDAAAAQQAAEYEQPAVQYKYVAVPAYKYVQQAPEYGDHQQVSHADYGDDRHQLYQ